MCLASAGVERVSSNCAACTGKVHNPPSPSPLFFLHLHVFSYDIASDVKNTFKTDVCI